jgi:hypothetical protein
MASARVENQLAELRQRVSRFLANRALDKRPLVRTLRDIGTHGAAYLFGGTLRDLMVFGPSVAPRDVDVVVSGARIASLARSLGDRIRRETRFGGLHLEAGGWLFDVWPLSDTWAFRYGGVAFRGAWDLPKTTFLTVEAVAVDLAVRPGSARRVYANGFFEALSSKTIEINFEENPFPELCVVRSLVTAARLRFAIGPRLARYIVHHASRVPTEQLIDVQRSHYGCVKCHEDEMQSWITAIRDQVERFSGRTVRLPVIEHRQLELWQDPAAAR